MTGIEYIRFRNWLFEEARQAKIKFSITKDDYSYGYSEALKDVIKKLGEIVND